LYLREHEPVTDLLRKEVVEEEVVQTMKHLDDEERARTCILYLDIDDFKSMNDTFGHNEGDLVLRGVADAVRAFIKPGDFAGRGDAGDEFIVFLRDASLDEANHVGELISAMVEQGQYLGLTHGGEKKRYRTSLSFGVAPYSPDFSFEEWKNAADADMYRRKRERKAAR
jgi:diguanylate cyclase (GGDEF)-like protein